MWKVYNSLNCYQALLNFPGLRDKVFPGASSWEWGWVGQPIGSEAYEVLTIRPDSKGYRYSRFCETAHGI